MENQPNWKILCGIAEQEITQALRDLPATLRKQAQIVPIALETKPSEDMQHSGIESDTLGLFTGPEWAEGTDVPEPPHIILYLENLWNMAERNEIRFREEIRVTFLHELGHFFGFDEDGLAALGLE